MSLSVSKPPFSCDSKAQENTHLIILVRSIQSSPSPCFLDVPEGVSSPLPISFTQRGISQNTRNKITQSSDALNFCKGAGPRLYFSYLYMKDRSSARLPPLVLIQASLQRHIIKMGSTEFHREKMNRPPGKNQSK